MVQVQEISQILPDRSDTKLIQISENVTFRWLHDGQAYETATATAELESQAVAVARENLRVQEQRYRSGATTIIDLITAQVSLSEADAELVQARYTTRLALSGLEAILGRRLY